MCTDFVEHLRRYCSSLFQMAQDAAVSNVIHNIDLRHKYHGLKFRQRLRAVIENLTDVSFLGCSEAHRTPNECSCKETSLNTLECSSKGDQKYKVRSNDAVALPSTISLDQLSLVLQYAISCVEGKKLVFRGSLSHLLNLYVQRDTGRRSTQNTRGTAGASHLRAMELSL